MSRREPVSRAGHRVRHRRRLSGSAVTDASGTAEFFIRAGGLCSDAVSISADGIVLSASYRALSPDQDGSLEVDGADMAIFNSKFGTADASADFDCDRSVQNPDRAVMLQHMGHNCEGIVPTLPQTWGRLKGTYR